MLFECSQPDERIITVQQEYVKGNIKIGEEAAFWDLYQVKLHPITLRELLLFSSIYVCKTLSQIVSVVQDQPNPGVFYKSCFELDGSNMTSILSFDSRSMVYLLSDDFSDFFSHKFPLFYKNKIQKGGSTSERYFYRSAIDNALKSNQIRAVGYIIDYIVRYQNYFVSSYLFNKNLPNLIEKGVFIKALLDSDVFQFTFDFDEWPSTHFNPEEELRPYNLNLF